ncbi:hypothetical protein SDC9_52195 [bioreactor metagenome]|uniref:Helix-turn-helix domain-containing protein n=1 Tax=bioreactor metagenome TaxID=1076179 RepID=A0A644WQ07_9ZZZZ
MLRRMYKKYEGTLFNGHKQDKPKGSNDIYEAVDVNKLINDHARLLIERYNTVCFDVKQMQEILNVGESNVYELLKTGCFPVKTIGKRKVVSAFALAAFLIKA